MATKLKDPVTREVAEWARDRPCGKDGKRPLLVTLNPAGFVTFRLKGLRQSYDLDFASAYMLAVRRFSEKALAESRKARAMRRAGLA